MEQAASPDPKPGTSVALSIARHAVPIAALLALHASLTPRATGFLTQWAAAMALVTLVSAAMAGAVTLYAKDRRAKTVTQRSRSTAWVVTLVLFISLWNDLSPRPRSDANAKGQTAVTASAVAASSGSTTSVGEARRAENEPAQDAARWPINPQGAQLLLAIRAREPALEGLSDEVAVRAIHQAYYSDLPLGEVAAKLGIRIDQR